MSGAMAPLPDPSIFKAYDIRGLYGEQIDGDAGTGRSAAHSRACSRGLAGKPDDAAARRAGPRHAPERARARGALPRRHAAARARACIDAGEVGTEMLYYLVGSRELDGGLMCTASHNPKPYTGAKLVREGAIALSGERASRTSAARSRPRARGRLRARRPGRAAGDASRRSTSTRSSSRRRCASSTRTQRAQGEPLKVVVDGGNGMAGPMVGPLLERLGLELIETYWTPDGNFPDHEPNPLLPENREFIIEQVRESGADLGIAWDGDADRCFFIDDTGAFVDGDFLDRAARRVAAAQAPGRGDPLRRACILGGARHGRERRRRRPTSTGSATPSSRRGCAREGSLFGGEVSGHYYFRDFYCADSGTIPALLMLELLSQRGRRALRAAGALPRALLHLRRDQLRGRGPEAQDRGDRRALRRRPPEPPRRHLDRLRGLALQRASLQHRAAAAPVPGVAALPRGHGAPPRRGARADPLVSGDEPAARSASRGRRARHWPMRPRRASTAWRSPRRSRSGASTPT